MCRGQKFWNLQHPSKGGCCTKENNSSCHRRLKTFTQPNAVRTSRTILFQSCFLVIGMLMLLSCDAASGPTFLHTEGQDIVNEKGDKVMLRGVGLGNWLLPEG